MKLHILRAGCRRRYAGHAMPMGSPGMEGPHKEAFDVLLVKGNGDHTVYQHYSGK
jgi:hypothetical protein